MHIGANADFLIDDTTDVRCIITKLTKEMCALKFPWESREVLLCTKINFYEETLMNLILWGSENWSVNANDLRLCEVFHHKAIRSILGISMKQVEE